MEGRSPSPPRRFKTLTDSLAKITNDVGKTIGRTAVSAGELLGDRNLRRKGAALIVREASKGLKGIQHGIGNAAGVVGRTIQNGAYGISQGPKHLQVVLERIQKRIEEQRIAAQLEITRNQPVDVQMGHQLYEDAPQELRTRLWCVLLESPDLAKVFQPLCTSDVPTHRLSSFTRSYSGFTSHQVNREVSPDASDLDPLNAESCVLEGVSKAQASDSQGQLVDQSGASSSLVLKETSGFSWQLADISSSMDTEGVENYQTGRETSNAENSPNGFHDNNAGCGEDKEDARGNRENAGGQDSQQDDEWEIVTAPRNFRKLSSMKSGSISSEPAAVTPHAIGIQLLNAAMSDLEWPLPTEYSEDSRYGILLQITIGQDEVDDIINRDIHRTFPEHPHFNDEHGRISLFNVLKAYSVHDLEVEYCQGMAFVAGVLLLYLPEEFAFRVFCRLMGPDGMNLRELYLPGLVRLKVELQKLEWLLMKHLPKLHAHLQMHGIPAVLYASQWLLTSFACPFPPGFAARVIDIMLIENNNNAMQRISFAILAECEEEVLSLTDFEDILTYLKVQPLQWPREISRLVLDYSLRCPVTDEEIQLAEAATQNEESGTGDTDSSNVTRIGPIRQSPSGEQACNDEQDPRGSGFIEGGRTGLEEELEMQKQEMDSEELKVLLSMDKLWDADEQTRNRQASGMSP